MFPEKRAAIIEAAMKVFAEKGYRGATSRGIAEAAGITPGTIYWYFKNKEDLFRAVIRERSPIPKIMAQVADPDRPPEEVIPELMDNYLRGIEEGVAVYAFRIVLSEAGHHPELTAIIREEIAGRLIAGIAGYLEEQVKRGRIRPMNLTFLAMLVMGPLLLSGIARFVLGLDFGPGTRQELVKTASQAILYGIVRKEGK
jgi:AcrR family transcriptional regulator